MDTAIISALVAVIGVALSSAFAYWIAMRQGSSRFNELLYKARLESYPELYAIVSGLSKHIRYATVTPAIVKQAAGELDEWDSQHTLLLSPISTKAIFELRLYLRLVDSEELSLKEGVVLKQLVSMIADVENSIKTEIGVYSLSDYHNPETVRDVSDYLPKATRNNWGR